jgi:hypothetical protein
MWAQILNNTCRCVSSDHGKLLASLHPGGVAAGVEAEVELGELDASSLFAEFPVFVDGQTVRQIEGVVAAVQQTIELPEFVEQALLHSPEIARHDQGTDGILHGFDFHVTGEGPRLIEINTNAGGALLNASLAEAQRSCCDAIDPFVATALLWGTVREQLLNGFLSEFALGRAAPSASDRRLPSVAIVDDDPEKQFLYREFLLFQQLFREHGLEAFVADPRELEHRNGALWFRGRVIDLVYNRLTDFYLETEATRAVRSAYLANDVILTPSPRHHALLANKRHLVTLSNAAELSRLGLPTDRVADVAPFVPEAELVNAASADDLWHRRRGLFFKPLTGYGSKAAYRGDKLTRTKFEQIVTGEYLAQRTVAPSERTILVAGEAKQLKLDLRAYVVNRRVVLLAARLYQGQTTNFRTRGGGFATVLAVPEALERLACGA